MLRYILTITCLIWVLAGVAMADAGIMEPDLVTPILVQGRVLDAEGHPMVDAQASLEPLISTFARYRELLPDGAALKPLKRTPVDGQGRFRLTAPGPGLYAVRVEAPGYLPVEHVVQPLLHDMSLPAAVLRPDEGIVVLVWDADGAKVEGARVVAHWRDGGPWTLDHVKGPAWGPATRRATSRRDGAAILPYVSGEELRVHVVLPEHALWTGLAEPQDVTLEVRLQPSPRSQKATVSSGGDPLPSALLVEDKRPLAQTDDSGHAQVPSFERSSTQRPKTLVLWAADGRRKAMTWRPGVAEFSVEAMRRRDGRVVDGVTGRPVPGALVWSPRDRHAVHVGDQGTFQWPVQRPVGPLQVAAPGYLPTHDSDGDGGSKSLRLVLQPAAEMVGRVVTEAGQPVAAASVELRRVFSSAGTWGIPGRWETVSSADGTFRFQGLEPNQQLEVWARLDGWVPTYAAVSTSVDEGDHRGGSVELVLKRGLALGGRVVDGASRPIAGAMVEIFSQPADGGRPLAIDDDGRSAAAPSTDAEGRFEITHIPAGQHLLMLSAPGYGPRIVPRLALDEGSRNLGDLVLESGQTLWLDLVNADGYGVSGAEVSLRWGLEQTPSVGGVGDVQRRLTTRLGRSNILGRVQMDDLPAGRLAVTVTHPDFAPLERNLTLPSELVTLTLPSGLKLSGRVVDTDNRGLAGLDILAETQARSLGSSPMAQGLNEPTVQVETQSDENGHFELVGIKPGTVAVTVRRSAFVLTQLELSLPPDLEPEPLHVVIDPGVDFQGRVLDARGEAVVGALVFMGYRDDPSFRLGLITDVEGQFWVRRAPRGIANLFVNGSDGERARIQVEVEPDMESVVLTMETERALEGQVVGPDGRGVAEAHLHFSTAQFSYRPPVDAKGRFSIPVKGAMDISLMATRPDMGWVIRDVEVPESGDLEAVELVVPRGVRIVGKVLGVSAGEMRRLKTHGVHKTSVQGMGAVRREGRVEPDAAYEIRGLMPGQVSVYAELEGSVRRVKEVVEIPPGVDEVTIDLDLGEPGLVLSGRVFHNGEPAHTALVIPGHVETDAEGRFRIDGIQTNVVALTLLGPWGRHDETFEMDGDREVEIFLKSFDVSGTVVDGSGQTLAEVNVECRLAGHPNFSCDHVTDAVGRFNLRGLPSGQYQLFFSKEGFGPGHLEVSLREDVSNLLITLQPGVDVTFSAQSWSGRAVTYLPIHFVGLEGQLPIFREGFAGDDGLIHVQSLPRGQWRAFVAPIGSRVTSLPITAPGGPFPVVLEAGGEIGFQLPNMELSAQGKLEVFDASGNAFTPRDVGEDYPHWLVRRQRAYVHGLAPGTWTYRVTLQDGLTFEGSAVVSPGQLTEFLLR